MNTLFLPEQLQECFTKKALLEDMASALWNAFNDNVIQEATMENITNWKDIPIIMRNDSTELRPEIINTIPDEFFKKLAKGKWEFYRNIASGFSCEDDASIELWDITLGYFDLPTYNGEEWSE